MSKKNFKTPVAALLAASLTAAALERAARAEGDKLSVVTTLHVLASLAKEIGGDAIDVEALARPTEDPHFVQPTPQRQVKLRDAQAFLEIGLQLEMWSEHVIDGARNPRIQRQADGHSYVADGCELLLKPRVADRSMGDVHTFGNPHVWLEPMAGHVFAKNIAACLARVSPASAETFEKNKKAFDKKLDEFIFGAELCEVMGGPRLEKLHHAGKLWAFLETQKYKGKPLDEYLGGLMKKARPLRGAKLLSYHQSFPYYAQTWGCEFVEQLEPKPGIAPTPAHLQNVEAIAKSTGAKVILVMPWEPRSIADEFATRIGGTVVALPGDVGAENTTDFWNFQETLVDRVVAALPKGAAKAEPKADPAKGDEKK
jgi:ABC-type Zn uptake system ZnuABC Zn-binding protein ZnuA